MQSLGLSLLVSIMLLAAPPETAQPLICTSVTGGYTIILSNREAVRLIGVGIPETEHPAGPAQYQSREAAAFTRKMVEGKPLRLEYDSLQRDKYGRLLAYVYLMDGTFLNAEIIKQGYGHAYTQHPCKYLDQFRQYELEAREAQRGLWADERPAAARGLIKEEYIGSRRLKVYHKPHCSITQQIWAADSRAFVSVKEAVKAGYLPCKICRPPYYQ